MKPDPIKRAAARTLVDWFKELWMKRTPPVHPDEVLIEYRIMWTEIYAKMRELGWSDGVVAANLEWHEIQEKYLRTWCKKHTE